MSPIVGVEVILHVAPRSRRDDKLVVHRSRWDDQLVQILQR